MLRIHLADDKPIDYIHDVDSYIYKVGIPDTELNRYLLNKLEGAKYDSVSSFIDRDGYKLPVNLLSTGMKCLLEVIHSGKCVNGTELGQNAFELLIQSANGDVYFSDVDRFELPEYFDVSNISVNGVVYDRLLDLENRLWKE